MVSFCLFRMYVTYTRYVCGIHKTARSVHCCRNPFFPREIFTVSRYIHLFDTHTHTYMHTYIYTVPVVSITFFQYIHTHTSTHTHTIPILVIIFPPQFAYFTTREHASIYVTKRMGDPDPVHLRICMYNDCVLWRYVWAQSTCVYVRMINACVWRYIYLCVCVCMYILIYVYVYMHVCMYI